MVVGCRGEKGGGSRRVKPEERVGKSGGHPPWLGGAMWVEIGRRWAPSQAPMSERSCAIRPLQGKDRALQGVGLRWAQRQRHLFPSCTRLMTVTQTSGSVSQSCRSPASWTNLSLGLGAANHTADGQHRAPQPGWGHVLGGLGRPPGGTGRPRGGDGVRSGRETGTSSWL